MEDNYSNNNDTVTEMTADWQKLGNSKNLKSSNRKLKILIILLLFLITLIVGPFAYFKFIKPDAKEVYNLILKEYKASINEVMNESIKNANNSYTQSGNIILDSDMNEYNMFNEISLDYSLGLDINSKSIISNIVYKEKDKDILKGDFYIKNNKLYLKSDQIYNKTLYLSDLKDVFNFEDLISIQDTKNMKYLFDKVNLSLQKALDKAKYETKYEKVAVNDKNTIVQKNIMIIDQSNANDIKNEFLNNIKSDSKLMDILAKISSENSNLKSEIEDYIKTDITSKVESINIEIDTQIITNKVTSIKVTENNQSVIAAELKSKNSYKITAYEDDKSSFEGTLTLNNENDISFETKIDDYTYNISLITSDSADSALITCKITDKKGKYFNISLKDSIDYNNKINKISVDDAIDASTMNNNESTKLQENLSKVFESSKLLSALMSE